MFVAYPATFNKERGAEGFSVFFPDLEGCFTYGDTVTDALEKAQEALGLYLYDLYLNGTLPSPSHLAKIKPGNDSENDFILEKSFVTLVYVDMEKFCSDYDNKTVRKNLTIPAWLNTKAEAAGINFSQTLQEALKRKIG